MLSVVKMPLKGEVGGHALVMEFILLIMENYGKTMESCFLISLGTLQSLAETRYIPVSNLCRTRTFCRSADQDLYCLPFTLLT